MRRRRWLDTPAAILVPTLLSPTGKVYLLRDEFSDTLAAGAVNGTPAVPGPGTRAVTDTESKLSVANGALTFSGGKASPAYGDPAYGLTAIARLAGRVALFKVTFAATNTHVRIGLSANYAGSDPNEAILHFSSLATMTVRNPNAVTVGTYTAAAHQAAIRLRATGSQFFIKGGAYTNWTLIWISDADSTASLQPVVSNYSQTAPWDYVRVPAQLWALAPLAADAFDRANGSLDASLTDGLAVEEVGGAGLTWTATTWTIASNVAKNAPTVSVTDVIVDGAMTDTANWDEGSNWSIGGGVASIASATTSNIVAHVAPLTAHTWYQVTWTNSSMAAGTIGPLLGTNAQKAYDTDGAKSITGVANSTAFAMAGTAATGSIDNVTCKAITLAELFASLPVGIADVLVELPITDSGSNAAGYQVGVVVNLDSAASPANFIIAYLTGNATLNVDEYVAGARTNKIAAAVTYAAGAKLKIIRRGTSAWVFYNEAAVGTVQTMTANTNTLHGMFSTYATPTVNNVAISASGTEGQYAALDAF